MDERKLLTELSKLLDQEWPFEDAGLGPLIVNIDAVGRSDWRPWFSIEYLGVKAVIAASSDVVAKGGKPVWYAVYVSDKSEENVLRISKAIRNTIKRLGGYAISGDTDSEPLRVVIATIGMGFRYVRRSSAMVDDGVYLLGPIGHGGALSYALKNLTDPPKEALKLMRNYDYFDPEWHRITSRANAAIDVSDSLAISLRDIANASGVRIEIDYDKLRRLVPGSISKRAEEHGIDPVELALYGGDEYVIIYTGEYLGGEKIGEVIEGSGVNAKFAGWQHWYERRAMDHVLASLCTVCKGSFKKSP